MNIQEFFDAYEGIWVEFSSIANTATTDQCVDLFQLYNNRVIGGPNINGNAIDYFTTFPTDFYDKITNTPTAVPQLGDVIIWGTKIGPYGHIAVCTNIANTNTFTSFDQNDPLKSPCHYQPHNYTGVLGWLRPKNLPTTMPVDPMKVKVDLGSDYGVMEVQAIISKLNDLTRNLKSAQDTLNGFVAKWIIEWNLPASSSLVDVETEMARLLTLEDQLQTFRNAIEGVVGAFDNDTALLQALQAVKTELSDKSAQIAELQSKLADANIPQGYKIVNSWTVGKYLLKLYRGGEK